MRIHLAAAGAGRTIPVVPFLMTDPAAVPTGRFLASRARALRLISLAALVVATLAAPGEAGAVTNAEGRAMDRPWLAQVFSKNEVGEVGGVCGASLIGPRALLTAAHCTNRDVAFVRLPYAKNYARTPLAVKSRIIHSRYVNGQPLNDIAILVLAKPVVLKRYAQLPAKDDSALRSLKSLAVIGWGADENGQSPEDAKISRQLDLSSSASRYYDQYNKDLLIAGGRTVVNDATFSGACNGDSGGPLAARFGATDVVVGVVAFGAKDCNAHKPTMYTRVAAYLDWLEQAQAAIK